MGRNAYTYRLGYNGTLQERMSNKTIKGSKVECWHWTASCDTAGYPTIRVNKKLRRASHIAFELHYGKTVPPGMIIMHRCDNPTCVNPHHLSLGTKSLNNLDKKQKGRCNPNRGEKHPMRKLSIADVDKIRFIYKSDKHTFTSIARRFNVNRTTIARIVRYESWNNP